LPLFEQERPVAGLTDTLKSSTFVLVTLKVLVSPKTMSSFGVIAMPGTFLGSTTVTVAFDLIDVSALEVTVTV
jgi:hypothetical protein